MSSLRPSCSANRSKTGKLIWGIVGLIIVSTGILFYFYIKNLYYSRIILFNNREYTVKTVITPSEQAKGLSGLRFLPNDHGMLFVFDTPAKIPFWMKDMNFPIDIYWLDTQGKVVYQVLNAQPCKPDYCPIFTPDKPAKYVLEINPI